MTQEELKRLMDEVKKAETDITPFPVVQDNDIAVVGDANKTEVKKTSFTMTFAIPKEENGVVKYNRHVVTYDNVYPKPRNMISIDRMLSILMPYIKKPMEDGSVAEYSEAENAMILKAFDEEVTNIMYRLVATVLEIDESLIDFMLPSSVFEALVQIIQFFPEAWNEGETFFE